MTALAIIAGLVALATAWWIRRSMARCPICRRWMTPAESDTYPGICQICRARRIAG